MGWEYPNFLRMGEVAASFSFRRPSCLLILTLNLAGHLRQLLMERHTSYPKEWQSISPDH